MSTIEREPKDLVRVEADGMVHYRRGMTEDGMECVEIPMADGSYKLMHAIWFDLLHKTFERRRLKEEKAERKRLKEEKAGLKANV